MEEKIVIDKKSKLFEKFMQNKLEKERTANRGDLSESNKHVSEGLGKENVSILSNIVEGEEKKLKSQPEEQQREVKCHSMTGLAMGKETLRPGEGKERWINNSLNVSNGMGLDQILKRAIEKVRQKRVEQLCERKEERERSDEDSLERLNESKKSYQNDGKRIENPIFSPPSAKPPIISKEVATSPLKSSKDSSSPPSCTTHTSLIFSLQAQISTLTSDLNAHHQKVLSLQLQTKKLKKQINDQITYSDDLQKERQQLLDEIKELERVTSAKEIQVKKQRDQANFWRNQHQLVLGKIEGMRSEVEGYREKVEKLEKQNSELKKQREKEDGDGWKVEMKRLEDENRMAKQYLYDLTIKLYNYEQQVIRLKGEPPKEYADLIPQEQQIPQKDMTPINTNEDEHPHRKRQFSRQRSAAIRSEIKPTSSHLQQISSKVSSQISSIPVPQNDLDRQVRIATLQRQLLELQDSKIVNGKIRRRKIELQRQLQELGY